MKIGSFWLRSVFILGICELHYMMKGGRVAIKAIEQKVEQQTVQVSGWIRSVRTHKTTSFIDLNDGSNLQGIQIVANADQTKNLTVGSCINVHGKLVFVPSKKKQALDVPKKMEIQADGVDLVGKCPTTGYPLQKKYHTLEFLRENLHLRARTNTFGAVARVRNALTQGLHSYFQVNDFIQVYTPVITSADCEGAGEQFAVSDSKEQETREPFFGKPASLTVSGQLHAETYACAMSKVYTFGPTFRAENSHTSRHLSEFWMLEPEMAFAGLEENINVAQGAIKSSISNAMEKCPQDIAFFNDRYDKELEERLRQTLDKDFDRITYCEAVELLQKHSKKFSTAVKWGDDLQSEHERFLAEDYFKGPVFVTDYPTALKPFYMRQNDDKPETVACMDLLVPQIGELIGGSVREEREDILKQKMIEQHLLKAQHPDQASHGVDDMQWYLDLRRFGTVPHAGWGLGFERLVQYSTSIGNIRDTIPFPRFQGSCPL